MLLPSRPVGSSRVLCRASPDGSSKDLEDYTEVRGVTARGGLRVRAGRAAGRCQQRAKSKAPPSPTALA